MCGNMIDRKLPLLLLFALGIFSGAAAQIPQEGLVGEYLFDDNDPNDGSGNQYHAEMVGASFGGDRFDWPGSCATFDGKGQYVALPVLPISGNFSVSFWIETTDDIADPWPLGTFIVDRDLCFEGNDWSIGFGDDGKIQFNTGLPDETLLSATKVNKGKWTHVVVQRDSAAWKKRIFINGKLDAEQTTRQVKFNNNALAVHLGGSTCDNEDRLYFKGKLDEVRFYNRDLEEDEIKELSKEKKEKYTGEIFAENTETETEERGEFLVINDTDTEEEAEETEVEMPNGEPKETVNRETSSWEGNTETSEEVEVAVEESEQPEEVVTEMVTEVIANNEPAEKEEKTKEPKVKEEKVKEEKVKPEKVKEEKMVTASYSPNVAVNDRGYPTEIDGKQVSKAESMVFSGNTIWVKLFDDKQEDGDVVSLFVNGECVLNNHSLTNKAEKVKIDMTGKGSFMLVLVANKMGYNPPASARLEIKDNNGKTSDILLNSTDKVNAAVEIIQGF